MSDEQLTLFPSPEPFQWDESWFQVVLSIWRREQSQLEPDEKNQKELLNGAARQTRAVV